MPLRLLVPWDENIIAVDIDDDKLEVASEMGAAKVKNIQRKMPMKNCKKWQMDALWEFLIRSVAQTTGRIAVRAMSKAGRYLLVGQAGGDFRCSQVWLPQKALTVRGSHVGNLTAVA